MQAIIDHIVSPKLEVVTLNFLDVDPEDIIKALAIKLESLDSNNLRCLNIQTEMGKTANRVHDNSLN